MATSASGPGSVLTSLLLLLLLLCHATGSVVAVPAHVSRSLTVKQLQCGQLSSSLLLLLLLGSRQFACGSTSQLGVICSCWPDTVGHMQLASSF